MVLLPLHLQLVHGLHRLASSDRPFQGDAPDGVPTGIGVGNSQLGVEPAISDPKTPNWALAVIPRPLIRWLSVRMVDINLVCLVLEEGLTGAARAGSPC